MYLWEAAPVYVAFERLAYGPVQANVCLNMKYQEAATPSESAGLFWFFLMIRLSRSSPRELDNQSRNNRSSGPGRVWNMVRRKKPPETCFRIEEVCLLLPVPAPTNPSCNTSFSQCTGWLWRRLGNIAAGMVRHRLFVWFVVLHRNADER